MDIKDIVIEYLKKNGYDGLYSEWGECGCNINQLQPCDEYQWDCKPGYKVKCDEDCCHHDGVGNGDDWHIQDKKPEQRTEGK